MVYALVRNGIVSNVIIAEPSFIPAIAQQYDFIVDVTAFTPQPNIGDTFNGSAFIPGSGAIPVVLDPTVNFPIAAPGQPGLLTPQQLAVMQNKISDLTLLPIVPARTLNSTFLLSPQNPTFVSYTILMTATAAVGGGQSGSVELRSDPIGVPTPLTPRARVSSSFTITLGIGIGFSNSQEMNLSWLVPPGYNIRLVSAGTALMSISQQSEIPFNFLRQ